MTRPATQPARHIDGHVDRTDRAPRCHRDTDGVRVTDRHHRDCTTSGCAGCDPCTLDHCRCGRHLRGPDHGERETCARCVGTTRTDLTRIRDLCSLAPTAAAERGAEALLVLAGPVPEHSTFHARRRWAYAGGVCQCAPDRHGHPTCPDLVVLEGPSCANGHVCGHPTCERLNGRRTCPGLLTWLEHADGPDLERHPLWVLGTWDMLIGEHLDHDRRARVTVAGATGYLLANLTYLAQDPTFGFDDLAREVRTCREHVERVMQLADAPQRGAPCPSCRAAGRPARALERTYRPAKPGRPVDDRDLWTCPTRGCELHVAGSRGGLTLDQYAKAVWVDYLGNADRLTAAQIQAQYRVPASTVRRWAAAGEVARHGYDGGRRQLYDVADVRRMRDEVGVVAVP